MEIVEVKTRCKSLDHARRILAERGVGLARVERQTDTYFHCRFGRLKLRDEDSGMKVVHYVREDLLGPKRSHVRLYYPSAPELLRTVLAGALGVVVIVQKVREVYADGNVRVHLDHVRELGDFVEIEVLNEDGMYKEVTMWQQCRAYMELLSLNEAEMISGSYGDLLLEKGGRA
ncbi:MAG: class IV adenylate cyclase [Chloroflexi bacterium]|nr:class IV adenylate cyclase [Chloroflexota bacterium]